MLRRILLILILVAVAAGGLWSWYSYRPKKEVPQPVDYTGPQPGFKPTVDITEEVKAKLEKIEKPKPLSDPFAVKVDVKKRVVETRADDRPEEPTKEVDFKLQGIWIDSGMKIAFINDQSLQVGDTIAGWRVAAIYQNSVVIKKGSRQKTLKVEE